MKISRRDMVLTGLGFGIAFAGGSCLAHARWGAPSTYGVTPAGGTVDQTAMLQNAIEVAASSRTPLFIPPGIYSTHRLELKSGTQLTGMPGKSILRYRGGGGLIAIENADDIRVDGLVLDGAEKDMGTGGALLAAATVDLLTISNCRILRSGSGGILVSRSENIVVAGNFVDKAATGIAVMNGIKGHKPSVVKGNVVRNLFFRKVALSHGNGIMIDADASVEGNSVENAPGFGILLGSPGNVSITDNRISNAHIGIGISIEIAETALIAGNRISGVKDGAIRAMNGPAPIGPDLSAPGIG